MSPHPAPTLDQAGAPSASCESRLSNDACAKLPQDTRLATALANNNTSQEKEAH